MVSRLDLVYSFFTDSVWFIAVVSTVLNKWLTKKRRDYIDLADVCLYPFIVRFQRFGDTDGAGCRNRARCIPTV